MLTPRREYLARRISPTEGATHHEPFSQLDHTNCVAVDHPVKLNSSRPSGLNPTIRAVHIVVSGPEAPQSRVDSH
jgi:hypothetical protein